MSSASPARPPRRVKLALILVLGTFLVWERPRVWSRVYLWAATMTYTIVAIYHGFGFHSVMQIT